MRGDPRRSALHPSSDPGSRQGHLLPQGEKERAPSRSSINWQGALSDADRAFLVDRYRRPQPRIALAAALRDHASAAMDVSDGLAGDAAKLLRASGVTGTLDLDRVPFSAAARAALAADPKLLDALVSGGDDYEILFTLPPERWDMMAREAGALGLPIATIGTVEEGERLLALTLNGVAHRLTTPSYQHFGA